MSLIFLAARPSAAARPTASLETSLERVMDIDGDSTTTTDTYKQVYRLSWQQAVSDRLNFTSGLKLTLDDVIESDDVDRKTVVPALDISLVNPVWDFTVSLSDSITYTNEFNRRRGDAISSSLEANLALFYMPVVNYSYNRIFTYQENLEDQVEEKIDARIAYTLGEAINLESSWKETETEDSMVSTIDRERTWNTTMNYSRVLWEAFKLDEVLTYDGSRLIERDQAASTETSSADHKMENKLKFTLTGFPALNSSLELTNQREFVDKIYTNTQNFQISLAGGTTALGVFKPSVNFLLEDVTAPDPSAERKTLSQGYILEFTGIPSKYLDYTTKFTVSLTDSDNGGNVADERTKTNTFDLSLVGHPRTDLSLAAAFNKSGTYAKGILTGNSRSFRLNLSYAGKSSNLPGLTVEPTIKMDDSYDRITEEWTRSKSLTLDIDYENIWPDTLSLMVAPRYSWKTDHVGTVERTLDLSYEVIAAFSLANGDFRISHKGDYANVLGDEIPGGEFNLNKETWMRFSPTTTSRFNASVVYSYKTPSGAQPADTTSLTLGYRYPSMYELDASFQFDNTRTFLGPKKAERTYKFKLTMTF